MALKPLLLALRGDLAAAVLKAAAVLIVAIIVFAAITLTTVLALPVGPIIGGHPTWSVPTTGGNSGDIPPDQLRVMRQVSAQTGVPCQVLAAIAHVESDFGHNMATNSARAGDFPSYEGSLRED